MGRLEMIDGSNWEEFVKSPRAVLMLAKSGCPACASFSEELTNALEAEPGRWDGVRFGKMILDQGRLASFKRASPWLAEVKDLPYTVIFVAGERTKSFAGGGLERLDNRLQSLG
jgi:hypothetical protein